MFLTFEEAESLVFAQLKVTTLPDYWTVLINQAQLRAYNLIVQMLGQRGYSLDQITAWDRGPEFEGDQTVYEALTRGGGLIASDTKWIDKLNRADPKEGELLTCPLTVNGIIVDPLNLNGQCVTGDRSVFQDTDEGGNCGCGGSYLNQKWLRYGY